MDSGTMWNMVVGCYDEMEESCCGRFGSMPFAIRKARLLRRKNI